MVEQSVRILDIVGGKGRHQVLVAGLCFVSSIVASWNVLGQSFFAYPMDYSCAKPSGEEFANLTTKHWKTLSVISNLDSESSKCLMNEVVRDNDVYRRTGATVKCQTWEYYDPVIRETIVSRWNLVCEDAWMVSTSQTVYMVGYLLSMLIFGQLGDRLGRRPVLFFCTVLYLVAGLITSLVNSYFFFVFFRFFVAFGIHGTTVSAFVILMELLDPKYRPVLYLSLSLGWAVGYTTIPGLAYITRDWAYLQLSFVCFGLTLLPFWWYCSESPRWLLTQRMYEDVESVLITVAKRNRIWNENSHIKIQQLILISDKEHQSRDNTKATLANLLVTPSIRKWTVIMFYIWFTTTFVYYGLILKQTDFVSDMFVNTTIFGALAAVSAILGCVCFSHVTRRPTFIVLHFFIAVLCFCNLGIPDSLKWVQMALTVFENLALQVALDLVCLYSAELFPTVVRNVGLGTSAALAKIGFFIAPLMKDMMSRTGKALPMAIFGALIAVAGFLVFFLPETKTNDLSDTLDEGEERLSETKVTPRKGSQVTEEGESTHPTSSVL